MLGGFVISGATRQKGTDSPMTAWRGEDSRSRVGAPMGERAPRYYADTEAAAVLAHRESGKTARQPLYLGRTRTGQARAVYSGGGRSLQQSQRQKFLTAACNHRRAKTALIAFLVFSMPGFTTKLIGKHLRLLPPLVPFPPTGRGF
jgi:hypothetical protein